MEKNVRKFLLIINFSEEESGKSIFIEFKEFFLSFLKKEILSKEEDFYLRCCLALFQIYLEYLQNPEEKIKTEWIKTLRPLIIKKYPISKKGIFVQNAEVEFLLQEIDRIININQNKSAQIEDKNESNRKNRLNEIRMNTIYVSSKQFLKKGDNKEKENKISKNNDIGNKAKNKSLNENNNHKIQEIKNEIIINTSDMRKKESSTIKLKKNDKINIKSKVITMRNTFNIIIKKRTNKSVNEKEIRKISLAKSFDLYHYTSEVYIKDNDDINNEKKKTIIEKKLTGKKTIIPANYSDEMNSDKTIRYKNNKLNAISFDFLLKQITSTDFIEKDDNIIFIYNFTQQCFCFIKKETIFQKVLNCYNYYKKLKTPFFHMKKLIYFLNLLIMAMYEYYHNTKIQIDKNIKNFYKNLDSELLKLIDIKYGSNTNKLKEKEKEDKKVDKKEDKKVDKKEDKKVDKKEDNFKVSLTKRTSNQFAEKIRMFEELQNKVIHSNNANNDVYIKKPERKGVGGGPSENLKDDELNDKAEVLNEIIMINSLLNKKEDNNRDLKGMKSKLKLYKEYLKRIHKNSISKGFVILDNNKSSINLSEKLKKKNYYTNYFSILNYEPEEIGEVLISITKADLNKIERRELYNAIFLKKGKEKTCPNINECITKFNKLTSFIIEDILSYDFPKTRAKVIHRWLTIAAYLKERKDHNDCFAIYSALQHYIISGLKLTKKEMKSKAKTLKSQIKQYCSIEGNYKNFREEMNKCAKNNEFYLPYLGILLRDISFFEANYDYIIDRNLINVEKIEKIQVVIDEFFAFKNVNNDNKIEGNLNLSEELNFFQQLDMIKEDDLEILANKLEPKFILSDFPQKCKRITNMDIKYYMKKDKSNKDHSNIKNIGSFIII